MLIGPPFGQSAWTFRTTGSKLLRVIFDTNRTQIFTKREISKLYTQKSCWNASWCCVKCVSGSSWSHSLPIIHIKTNSKDSKRGRQTSNVTRIEADEGLINWRSERNQTFIRHQSHFYFCYFYTLFACLLYDVSNNKELLFWTSLGVKCRRDINIECTSFKQISIQYSNMKRSHLQNPTCGIRPLMMSD